MADVPIVSFLKRWWVELAAIAGAFLIGGYVKWTWS